MNKVSSIRRPALAPHEEAEMQSKALAGIEATELAGDEIAEFFPVKLFEHQYGRVRTDRVIAPKGMPPADWDLLPIGSLK